MNRIFTILLIILSISIGNAQVGINNPNPDSTSVLDLTSITQGFLVPRMTLFQRGAIGNPANGLVVYDKDEKMLYYYDNTYTPTGTDGKAWKGMSPFLFPDDNFTVLGQTHIRNIYTHPSVKNIGIATNSPLNKLTIFGNVSIGDSTTVAPINGLFVKGNIVTDTLKSNVLVGFGTTPIGGIIMWSGTIANIPAGWKLCDGSTILDGNSPINNTATPNLKGRFIVGYDSNSGTAAYVQKVENYGSVGNTGGETAHTLSTPEIPSHLHNITHGHVLNDPGHTHTIALDDESGGGYIDDSGSDSYGNTNTGSSTTGITLDNFTGDSQYTGGGLSHENRPPYFVLAYIMRIK